MTWFKMYRGLFDSDLWHDVTTFRLFMLLIGRATHQDGVQIAGVDLKKGQYLRSYRKLAEDLAYKEGRGKKEYSTNTIKRCIDKLIKSERVSKVETEQGTLFTVLNYAQYQELTTTKKETINGSKNEVRTFRERSGNNNKKAINASNASNASKDIKSSRKRVYDESSTFHQIAVYFYEQIKTNNPNHKQPNFQTWSDDVRKMMELDERTEDQVRYLMRWVQQDDFEMANVLSPAKLRQRFDQLIIKVKQKQSNGKVTPIRPDDGYNYGF